MWTGRARKTLKTIGIMFVKRRFGVLALKRGANAKWRIDEWRDNDL